MRLFPLTLEACLISICCLALYPRCAMALVCPDSKFGLVMNYRAVPEDPALCVSTGVKPILEHAGYGVIEHTDFVLSDTPTLRVEVLKTELAGRGVLHISTHGGDGGFSGEYYANATARDDKIDWYRTQGYTVEHLVAGGVVGSPISTIRLTASGIAGHLTMAPKAGVVADFCDAFQGASSWPTSAFVGLSGQDCRIACAATELWQRLGCQNPCLDGTMQQAFNGYPGDNWLCLPVAGIPGFSLAYASGVDNWALNCGEGCEPWPEYFHSYGAFGDTAYCEMELVQGTLITVLRGYQLASDYPNNPTILDTVLVYPSSSGRAVAASGGLPSMALYDWAVPFGTTGQHESRPFVGDGQAPQWWGTSEGAYEEQYGIVLDEWTEPGGVGGPPIPAADSTDCADIVIYAIADSLANPVKDQIELDWPGSRVRVILAPLLGGQPDGSGVACRAAVREVWEANRSWNAWCLGASCGRTFPEEPGPELYIVAAYDAIRAFEFADPSGACQGGTCASDALIYDFDGDMVPEGPVSRVPCWKVDQATRMAGHAHQFNVNTFGDYDGGLVTLAGGTGPGVSPEDLLDDVGSAYESMGIPLNSGLRERDFPPGSAATFSDACSVALETGVREQWWFGDHTNNYLWAGGFAYTNAFPTTVRNQRSVAWAPGCWTLNPSLNVSGSIAWGWLNERGGGTRLAAAVGSLDIGWDRFHLTSARHLMNARSALQANGAGVSVARVVYEATRAAAVVGDGDKTNALSLAVWGSAVRIDPRTEEVHDLAAGAGKTTAAISWSEPGQSAGVADEYEIRYQAYTPLTEGTFGSGILYLTPPSPGSAGTLHCVELSGLGSCRPYYFAIKTRRGSAWSPISNVAAATTKCTGFSIAICEGEGLMGGGGGGESARPQGPVESQSAATALVGQGLTEQSLLSGAPGERIVDVWRVPGADWGQGRGRVVYLRQQGKRRAQLDRVSLGYVDHPEGTDAINARESVLVGTAEPPEAVMEEGAGRIVALEEQSSEWKGRAGESLVVSLKRGSTPAALVLESRSTPGPATSDSMGIAVQVPDGEGGWRLLRTVYPRREFDTTAISVGLERRVKLTLLRACTIRSVGALARAAAVTPTPLTVVDAEHSRLGAVADAWSTPGGEVTLTRADSLSIAFEPSAEPPSGLRSFFLTLSGSYELDAEADGFAQQELMGSTRISWSFGLAAAYPNPSAGSVTFGYTLARACRPELKIYDVAGRLVRTLVRSDQAEGPHEVVWDGRNAAGRKATAGVYFYRLQAEDWHSERKLVVIQ